MKEAGHHVVGDRDRAQRGVHGRPSNGALVAALINSSAARAKAGVSTRSPRIRRSAFTQPV